MRGTIKHYNVGEYRFDVEFDSGAGPDDQYIIWVSDCTGEPICNNKGWQVRHCIKKFDERQVENFCRKFVSDPAYRRTFLLQPIDKRDALDDFMCNTIVPVTDDEALSLDTDTEADCLMGEFE